MCSIIINIKRAAFNINSISQKNSSKDPNNFLKGAPKVYFFFKFPRSMSVASFSYNPPLGAGGREVLTKFFTY